MLNGESLRELRLFREENSKSSYYSEERVRGVQSRELRDLS